MKTFNLKYMINLPDLQSVTQQDGVRYYQTPENNYYPSVTTILSKSLSHEGLDKWKEAVGEESANRTATIAASKGKNLHNICEKYLRNQPFKVNDLMPDMRCLFKSFLKAFEHVDPVIMIEGALWCDEHKFAGRTDVIAAYRDKLSIIDFKTNESEISMNPEIILKYFIQEAAYAIAFKERTGININQGVIFLGSVGYNSEIIIADLEKYKKLFLTAVKEYYSNGLQFQNEIPKI